MIRIRLPRVAVLAVAVICATSSAQAKSGIEIGTLTCVGGEGVGLILGSKKSYNCSFAPATGGPTEGYEATVTKIGLDLGVTGKTTIVWTVFAASQVLKHKALKGTYFGAAADASLGLGAGAKVLVGGSGNTITLQPLSVQGQTGVNLAVGIAGLSLQ